MLVFFIGLFIGGAIGYITCALLAVNKHMDEIFSWEDWEEVYTMTKAEAEAKLGCKIVG